MAITRIMFTIILALAAASTFAEVPAVESPLPLLSIGDRGELKYEDNDFSFAPWRSDHNPGKVHVVQYFGGTKGDSETFRPFTDLLQETFELGTYHVTTIINLDAALWGTAGFVVSEIKESKREHPMSTLVLDEEGSGAVLWQLGEEGAGLAVLDSQGIVRYFTRQTMSAQEMHAVLDLVRANIDG